MRRTQNIGREGRHWILDRGPHDRLGGHVQDQVESLALQRALNRGLIAQVGEA